ncbi:MAG: saccharopine dehydrogenase NADP-binding domain-containing protein [Desulfobacterales bacterium]|nr:MAG: saccharopine dehydrogenase NADP-binding domain-containing protein [Desulfobacterales bacterium]
MKVLILGAAGGMSLATIKDLLATADASQIIISDLDQEKVARRAKDLGDPRLVPLKLNVTEVDKVAEVMRGVDVVINASSYQFNLHAMRAAMQAGVPLIDLGGLYVMTRKQLELHTEVAKSGILVIPGIGSDPGTSNVLGRYGAAKLDEVDEIQIRFGTNWSGQTFGFAIETVLDEAVQQAVIFENGEYREVPALSMSEEVVFREPIGSQKTFVILHSELATLPQFIAGIKKVTYFDTWDPATIQKIQSLSALGLLSEKRVKLGDLETTLKKATIQLLAAAVTEEKPSEGWDDLKVTVKGTVDGKETAYCLEVMTKGSPGEGITPTAYSTGIPLSIVAQMIAKGEISGQGVLPPEACIPPEKYLAALTQRAIEVFETKTQTHPF